MIAHTISLLSKAKVFASQANVVEFLSLCEKIIEDSLNDTEMLLSVGNLLLAYGYLSRARSCFDRVREIVPSDLRPLVNLGNLYREQGKHQQSTQLYSELKTLLPNHPVIRRNILVGLEYDPDISDEQRFNSAKEWGVWAIEKGLGTKIRPNLIELNNRKVNIGYVSADFCQHTVGLFVKDVLNHHDTSRMSIFTYSAGVVNDWVTNEIRNASQFRDVSSLDDYKLADLIRNDNIDILVDLSGHTAGSRLSVFAHRPAAVQVSWLGYFATTGLEYIDAILLDEWHAPIGFESQFIERIIRLPMGRFYYKPVPYAPEVSLAPYIINGYITFGSFNNTAKYNDAVYDVWAKILKEVPDSRLVLKWRTFADEELCKFVKNAFNARGINSKRVELRGASFHVDMLKEYADIDIALDPFPFTGGLTSCESLWMSLPIVTLPQGRIVSRQTHAFLSAIGLSEFSANNEDDYVRIAVNLASDKERLNFLRQTMRQRMKASPLMDVKGFTKQLESTYYKINQKIYEKEVKQMNTAKSILHIGPGHRNNGAKLPKAFQTSQWNEIRLDIDPANEPDILGSMLNMNEVDDESIDAIYSSHNIEHVYSYEVPVVLKEFLRVLKPNGFLLITCPDLQTVCTLVSEDKLTDPAYNSSAGPITPLDILYGHGAALADGHQYMAHKCGFTLKSLTESLRLSGFQTVAGMRRIQGFDIWVVASKSIMDEIKIRELAKEIFPT